MRYRTTPGRKLPLDLSSLIIYHIYLSMDSVFCISLSDSEAVILA